MDQAAHNKIVSFIWGIADDVLRDLFKRGKYADVILPMCVLRRFDAVLEPTKQAVLEAKSMLDKAAITEQHRALCNAADQAFYNTSPFTLKDLSGRSSQAQLKADFEAYLNGFSENVRIFSKTSSSVTRFLPSLKPTPSALSSINSSTPKLTSAPTQSLMATKR